MTELKGKRFKTDVITEGKPTAKRTPRFKTSGDTEQQVQSNIYAPVAHIPVTSEEPVRISPETTGSLQKLESGQGAVVQDRENAASTTGSFKVPKERLAQKHRPQVASKSRDIQVSKKPVLAILAVALAVCCLMAFMFHGALSSSPSVEQLQTTTVSQDGVELDGNVFSFSEGQDGVWSLISKPKDSSVGDIREYCKFEGTPVALVVFNGNFIVGEDLKDGSWDIVSYAVTDGAIANKLVDKDGAEVKGKGTLKSLSIDGSTLNITLEDGTNLTQPLT